MARTNNLTNYLTDIANSIRGKKYENLEISSILFENPPKIQASSYDNVISNIKSHCMREDLPQSSNNIIIDYVMSNNLLTDIDFSSNYTIITDPYGEFLFRLMQVDTITGLSSDYINTGNCTSFRSMFEDCWALQSLDISFDTSNAEIMEFMFSYCTNLQSLTLDINTENCIDFIGMFEGCNALETITGIENFDVSNAISFSYMFDECNALTSLDLSLWTPTNLTDIRYMFSGCTSLEFLDVRNFEFSNLDSYYIDYAFNNINTNCEIIVKDNTEKSWFTDNYPELGNVKTVVEYEV